MMGGENRRKMVWLVNLWRMITREKKKKKGRIGGKFSKWLKGGTQAKHDMKTGEPV